MRKLLMLLLIVFASPAAAEDGYDLWLRYRPVGQPLADRYFQHASAIVAAAQTPALSAASDELQRGLSGLLGRPVPRSIETGDGSIIMGTPALSPDIASLGLPLQHLGREGYLIRSTTVRGKYVIAIAANSDVGVLYGAFALLRRIQTHLP